MGVRTAAIMAKQRYQVTEMPNKAPRNYPQLSPLELLRGDLKGMFGAVAGSGLLPDDMQDLGVVGKYAPRECSNCGSDQVRVSAAHPVSLNALIIMLRKPSLVEHRQVV